MSRPSHLLNPSSAAGHRTGRDVRVGNCDSRAYLVEMRTDAQAIRPLAQAGTVKVRSRRTSTVHVPATD